MLSVLLHLKPVCFCAEGLSAFKARVFLSCRFVYFDGPSLSLLKVRLCVSVKGVFVLKLNLCLR